MEVTMGTEGGHRINITRSQNPQVQVGTSDSSQFQMVTAGDLPSQEIREFIRAYRERLDQMRPSERRSAKRNLKIVEDQLDSPPATRDHKALREGLHSLRNIAEGATGGVVFAGLVELARRINF